MLSTSRFRLTRRRENAKKSRRTPGRNLPTAERYLPFFVSSRLCVSRNLEVLKLGEATMLINGDMGPASRRFRTAVPPVNGATGVCSEMGMPSSGRIWTDTSVLRGFSSERAAAKAHNRDRKDAPPNRGRGCRSRSCAIGVAAVIG